MPQPTIMEREEAKRKRNAPDENGKRKTRIGWDCKDPDGYAQFHIEKSRYMALAKNNPVLCTEAICMALRIQTDEHVTRFIEALEMVKENQ